MQSLKESALNYARVRIKVFPLKQGSKSGQVLKSWKNEATTDINQVDQWWSANPLYNVGIATGEGLLVIDVDCKNGHDGTKYIEVADLPATMKVKTPSGGYHLYYYVNKDFKNTVNLYDGIDIRSAGGYVVAAPSQINGKIYQVVNNEPICEANEKVYSFLQGAGDSNSKSNNTSTSRRKDKIEKGQRNDVLFKKACELSKSKVLSEQAVLSALQTENNTKCSPPLSSQEVEKILQSALKYVSQPVKYDLSMVKMSEVEEKPAEWLSHGFIPKGAITVIGGDGGAGKTTVWCNIVANVSAGKPSFFETDEASRLETREPQKVMFFSSEDDLSLTLKKRLKDSGANMDNIITVPIEDERFQDIKYDSEFLKNLIEEFKPALLVFDPLQGFIPSNINMGYRNAMRNLLKPLIGYGAKYGVTTIIICHTNKRENAWGRNRFGDSSDIWDIARCAFLVGHTGTDDIRYLSHEKCNYGPLMETTLFSIEDGKICYLGTTKKRDREFMTGKAYERKGKNARDEAKEFILDQLREHGGKMDNSDLKDYAEACGISSATYDRAKSDLKKGSEIMIEVSGKGENRKSLIFINS